MRVIVTSIVPDGPADKVRSILFHPLIVRSPPPPISPSSPPPPPPLPSPPLSSPHSFFFTHTQDGQLQVGDHIISVDGHKVLGVKYEKVSISIYPLFELSIHLFIH